MHLIKLAVLGSAGSGKTSLIRQFVRHDLNDCKQKLRESDGENHVQKFYYPTVIVDDRVYEVQIADLPPLQHFPKDTLEEWNTCRGYGLRQATAFLLVFDASSQESFSYVRQIRDQILQYKDDPVILVAGNKQDLLFEAQAQADQQRNHPVVNGQLSINRQNSVIG
uniref:Uncharacterized protein n=1 Tax=Romanomermis culicivorax TaxID=13658 RepID=A0A915ICS0_ROMCU